MPGRLVCRHDVWAGQHRRGQVRHGDPVGANIAALVVPELVLDREQSTIGGRRGADMVDLVARLVGGDQVLAPVFDPFDRPPQSQCRERRQHVFRIKLAAHPETTADMTFKEMHRGRGAAEHSCQGIPVPVRHLGGAVHFERVGGRLVADDGAACFQRHAGVSPGHQFQLDRDRGGGERRIGVAVAFAQHHRLGRQAGRELAQRAR